METPTTYSGLVGTLIEFINLLIPALFAVLFVYLVWKVIDSWVLKAGDPAARDDGKKYVIAAFFVFVLMLSAWGIVRMVSTSLFG